MVVDSYALCMGGGAAAGGGTGLRTGDQPAEPEDRRCNGDRADGFGHGDFYCAARDRRDVPVAAVLIVERRGHPARESQWKYLWGHGILRAREENREKNMNDKPEKKEK